MSSHSTSSAGSCNSIRIHRNSTSSGDSPGRRLVRKIFQSSAPFGAGSSKAGGSRDRPFPGSTSSGAGSSNSAKAGGSHDRPPRFKMPILPPKWMNSIKPVPELDTPAISHDQTLGTDVSANPAAISPDRTAAKSYYQTPGTDVSANPAAITSDRTGTSADSRKKSNVVVIADCGGVASNNVIYATALTIPRDGPDVMLLYQNQDEGAKAIQEEIKRSGKEVMILVGDFSNKEIARTMIQTAALEYEFIDALIIYAGIGGGKAIDCDYAGKRLCREAAKVMMENNMGRIINVISIVDPAGNVMQDKQYKDYARVLKQTEKLIEKYSKGNITANVVAAGYIASKMTDKFSTKARKKALKSIPLGRFGEPEEVAGLIKFLVLDPAAAYITGQMICIDGGLQWTN